MKTGRKPKPAALKLSTGNPGHRPIPTEPRPSDTMPEPPDCLNEIARAEWDRVAPELFNMGVLTVLDRAALCAYCSAWSWIVQAEKIIAKDGLLVDSKRGSSRRSAALQVAEKAMETMRKFASELGLTPSSRVGLGTVIRKPPDALEAMLERHQAEGLAERAARRASRAN